MRSLDVSQGVWYRECMTNITEEFTKHALKGMSILLNDLPDAEETSIESINEERDVRKKIREWHEKFTDVLAVLDNEALTLRIMPYEAPSRRHGEPAYDVDGIQMLVEVVDNFTDEKFARVYENAMYWVHSNNLPERRIAKMGAFYNALFRVRNGTLDKPEPEC